jgi:hypothetical protein
MLTAPGNILSQAHLLWAASARPSGSNTVLQPTQLLYHKGGDEARVGTNSRKQIAARDERLELVWETASWE